MRDLPGTEFEVRAPLIISSIGSIPEPIPGIPSAGELFRVEDPETGKVEGYRNVFAVGNAVTGKGNIRESELHARKVSRWVMDNFLQWTEEDYQRFKELGGESGETPGPELQQFIQEKGLLSVEQIEAINQKIKALQERAGYNGDYWQWREKHLPVRLEQLIAEGKARS